MFQDRTAAGRRNYSWMSAELQCPWRKMWSVVNEALFTCKKNHVSFHSLMLAMLLADSQNKVPSPLLHWLYSYCACGSDDEALSPHPMSSFNPFSLPPTLHPGLPAMASRAFCFLLFLVKWGHEEYEFRLQNIKNYIAVCKRSKTDAAVAYSLPATAYDNPHTIVSTLLISHALPPILSLRRSTKVLSLPPSPSSITHWQVWVKSSQVHVRMGFIRLTAQTIVVLHDCSCCKSIGQKHD
jgi:hypothetical protein